MRLSLQQLADLKNILETAPRTKGKEEYILKTSNPGLGNTSFFAEGEHTVVHYSRVKNTLTDFIDKLTGRHVSEMTALHSGVYFKGTGNKKHVDNSDTTIVIILDMNCEGGEFLLNGVEQKNFNKSGDYIIYNGGRDEHEVLPILEGTREVLVAWYKKPVIKSLM